MSYNASNYISRSIQIQTIRLKQYFKWIMSYSQTMLIYAIPILTNYKVNSSHIDIMKDDNSTSDYSCAYNMLSHALIHKWRLMIHITIDNGGNNTVGRSSNSGHLVFFFTIMYSDFVCLCSTTTELCSG